MHVVYIEVINRVDFRLVDSDNRILCQIDSFARMASPAPSSSCSGFVAACALALTCLIVLGTRRHADGQKAACLTQVPLGALPTTEAFQRSCNELDEAGCDFVSGVFLVDSENCSVVPDSSRCPSGFRIVSVKRANGSLIFGHFCVKGTANAEAVSKALVDVYAKIPTDILLSVCITVPCEHLTSTRFSDCRRFSAANITALLALCDGDVLSSVSLCDLLRQHRETLDQRIDAYSSGKGGHRGAKRV